MRRIDPKGRRLRSISMRLLAPAQLEAMAEALKGCRDALVIEQNQSGQLYTYLKGHFDIDVPTAPLHRPGPLPLRPQELETAIKKWMAS